MKKQTRKVLLSAATLAALSSVAGGAQAATDALSMSAKIIAAVQVTAQNALDFGSLTYTGAGGTVTMDATTGNRAAGGNVSLVGGVAGGDPGTFDLKGAKSAVVVVTMPATDTIKNGTKALVVDKFTIGGATKLTKALATVTSKGFKVGGRLNVTAAAPTGTYTGTVTLTAAYQ
ncbi:MAG: DUF4402 domain-containing protein [Rhodospirillales bacterium]|nr:DUF4402 domain-containing protein [Rhodospirillales bacterium]MCB9994906.1 DUF4402 domain-containing protein [Rhodospirillales bacterium]